MLFNSFAFLLVFLPAALILHALVEHYRPNLRLPLLVVISVVFYAYWDWHFVPLLVASVGLNWLVAEYYVATRKQFVIPLAIAANLLVLGIFKYLNFFLELASATTKAPVPHLDIVLPLGISFFTFHHIMYLADLRAGRAPRFDFTRYALYIAFFPQILAGPLVRWSEVMHQFKERPYARPDAGERMAQGIMLLVAGLVKKVFLGDPLAQYVDPVFRAAASGQVPTVLAAWEATLGFTFQIYFDFSGYTDMALGLALMFGIVLPPNFNVPYRATSLQDFWRRWHMTLSRFLRDYLYIPLGGSRHGLPVQLWALFATMTLGGLWHGAGLTFVAWGVAHGLGLGAGILWRRAGWPMPSLAGWTLTFAFVVLTWVLFRAPTFDTALRVYQGLFGFAPWGTEFKWPLLALAAAVAMMGAPAAGMVQRMRPRKVIAVAFATAFVVVLLKIGDGANRQFIYFQF